MLVDKTFHNTGTGKADDVTTCGCTDAKFTFKMYKFSKYKPGHEAHGVPPTVMGAPDTEDPPEALASEEEDDSLCSQNSTYADKPSLTLLVPQQLLSPQYINYLTSGQATMELASVPPPNTQGDNANEDNAPTTETRA